MKQICECRIPNRCEPPLQGAVTDGPAPAPLRPHSVMLLNSQAIHDVLQEAVQKFGLPQISVSLTVCGETARFVAGTLSTTDEHRYDLACVKKLLISLATLHLVARETLSLDMPVITYVPELEGTPRAASLRIWHLLSNTSGYGCMWPSGEHESTYATLTGLLDFVRYSAQLFVPGTVFSYQLEDHRLLAEVLRRATGLEGPSLVKDLVFSPLGIDVTSGLDGPRYRFEPSSRIFQPYCADNKLTDLQGGLPIPPLTNASLGRLAVTLMQASVGGVTQPSSLIGASLLLTHKTIIPVAAEYRFAPHTFWAYGFGCGEYPDGTLGHSGSSEGQCCALRFDPLRQLAVAVSISACVPRIRDVLLNAILRLCGLPSATLKQRARPPQFQADELVGRYSGGDKAASLEIRRSGTDLLCLLPPATAEVIAGRPRYCPADAVFALEDGRPILHPRSRYMNAVFFRDPTSDAPCLMLGLCAYKRRT